MHVHRSFASGSITRFRLAALALLLVATFATRVSAQINVFIDWTNFQTRLNSATTTAGVPAFDATEVQTIQTNVINYLNTTYAGYLVNFTTTNPGGAFETLTFGLTGSGFGVADRIDFRNKVNNDVARVFTANFSTFILPADPRATQIIKLSNSLGGTACHELGHNLGLEHRDPYGIAGIGNANANGGHVTNGAQNVHIMATGITGLTNAQRVVARTFADLEHAKLQFAAGLTAAPIAPLIEQGAAHSTAATAQPLSFTAFANGSLAYSAGFALEGNLSAASQTDFYSIQLLAGTHTTFQTISAVISGIDTINSILALFDTNGTTILATNDNVQVNNAGVNMGGTTYSNDSGIYNFFAAQTGTYYLRVTATTAADVGAYTLFGATTAIPEPTGVILLAGLFIAVGTSRRTRAGL